MSPVSGEGGGGVEVASTVTEFVGEPVPGPAPAGPSALRPPRLSRHVIRLADGHRVQLAVSGRGVPLVVVHGFSAEGILYAQTLSRLVSMGFKVVAIDTAGHGGTAGLADGGGTLKGYAELLGRVVGALGIRRAVLVGHSMGGRLVVELAARQPQLAIAVLPVDAIVGGAWDGLVNVARVAPALLGGIGLALLVDSLSTMPVLRDPRQAAKLARLFAPVAAGHARRPLRLVAPGLSILRSGGSRWMLDRLGQDGVPVIAIHGDRDLGVPVQTAASAARWANGQLVVVHGATHSWLLKDPESLPAIVAELVRGRLGRAVDRAIVAEGLDPATATLGAIEGALYEPGARVLELTPPLGDDPEVEAARRFGVVHRRGRRPEPRFRWTTFDHA